MHATGPIEPAARPPAEPESATEGRESAAESTPRSTQKKRPTNPQKTKPSERSHSERISERDESAEQAQAEARSIFDADLPVIDLEKVLAAPGSSGLPKARARRWLASVAAMAAVTAAGVFGIPKGIDLISQIDDPSEVAVAAVTITAPTMPAAVTTAPITTTSTTTTTTSTTTTTTPTTTIPPPLVVAPIGEPVDTDQLRLSATGIGSLAFGDPGDVVLGVLAASLGEPDEISGPITAHGQYGTCDGDPIGLVRWGPLLVVTLDDPEAGSIFYAYRLDMRGQDGEGGAHELLALSGIRPGDTVKQLEGLYSSRFTVEYVQDPIEGLVFELRPQGAPPLLWGPVTSSEPDGIIEGIFGPEPCRRG